MREFSVTLTGVDGSGTEVAIVKGVGRIADLKPSGAAHTVEVFVAVPKLQYPIRGWVPASEEAVLDILREAKETDRPVSFRVESQRKSKVDPSIPIAELRKTPDEAKKHTTPLFVGVAFADTSDSLSLTGEAVTDPDADEGPRNRVSAIGATAPAVTNRESSAVAPAATPAVILDRLKQAAESGLPQSVVDQIAAQAYVSGASAQEVMTALVGNARKGDESQPAPRTVFAREEAAWKDYNSDGRDNLGSIGVGATVSAVLALSRIMEEAGVAPQNVLEGASRRILRTLVERTLTVCDLIQVAAYGQGFIVDRKANSHSRIRGIAYDVMQSHLVPPLTKTEDDGVTISDDELSAWSNSLYKMVLSRFRFAVDIYLGVPEPEPAPSYVFTPEDSKEGVPATEETISLLKELVAESEITNLNGLGTLLRITLGHNLASKVDNALLQEFIGFYVSHESDTALADAIEWAVRP